MSAPLRTRRIGLIFQDDLLFPHLSVRDNLRFGLKGWSHHRSSARTAEVAALLGVESLLDRRPATLSGGERQRVGLARALAPRPRLLLCDEPVSALDLETRFAILERLRAIQLAESIPVLYVTHSPSEAVAIGSRLFLLDHGLIVAEGRPLDVLATSLGRTSARLEGLRNVFSATIASHSSEHGETRLRLDGGPELVVPLDGRPVGSALSVVVPADDILLAIGPISGLSARNRLDGVVDRLISRGPAVEVILRTGSLSWIASVTASAASELALAEGADVKMIVKARSCRLI